MVKRYGNVSLPEELLKEINDILKEGTLGYKTRGEFVKESVRDSLKELRRLKLIMIQNEKS